MKKIFPPILWAHMALFTVNMLYGASHILAKGVMPAYLTPSVFILLRVFGATMLFWIILSFSRNFSIERKDWIRLIACGLFGVTINQLFFFHGLNLSSSVNSGIIMAFNPILVVILSALMLKEKITLIRLIGIFIGGTGAILLTLTGKSISEKSLGDIYLLINSFSYAIYLILAKPLMKKYSPILVITWIFTTGLGFLFLYPPVLAEFSTTNFTAIPFDIWVKVTYVVVGVTFLTYLLTMFGLKHLSPSVSSSYIYFQPIMVIGFAYLFLYIGIADDYTSSITFQKIIYMLLIFLGVYLSSRNVKNSF
ncbi:MAG: EamA/RhaT family transporter [Bacteroidetes bacterium]|nr:EamA/RhaT family transporter [Bacteroidota bacterium]